MATIGDNVFYDNIYLQSVYHPRLELNNSSSTCIYRNHYLVLHHLILVRAVMYDAFYLLLRYWAIPVNKFPAWVTFVPTD